MSSEGARERREGSGRSARNRRGPGLGSALAGAGLLMVLGFALGVVGGLVLEEPDLLLDYVLGRTEPVPVGEGALDVAARPPAVTPAPEALAGAPAAAVAEAAPAADPEPWAEGPVEQPEEAPAKGASAPPPQSAVEVAALAPAPAGGFAVQVGAFADAAAAEQLARRLRDRGHPVYVAPAAGSDTARWRVRVGPLASRAEAEGVAARLEREERVSTWVLAESPL